VIKINLFYDLKNKIMMQFCTIIIKLFKSIKMKKITLIVFTFLFSSIGYAQYMMDDTQNLTFIDISTTGTEISLTDDGEVNITTPWTVYLGQQASTNLRVGNNGAILFGVSTGEIEAGNSHLSTTMPMIAPFWDDLDTEVGGVYYETKDIFYNGVPIASKFIIQWNRVHFSGQTNTNPAIFQVVFYRDTKKIEFIYEDVDMGSVSYNYGNSATIGIATQDEVTEYSYNSQSLNGISSIVFSEPKTYVPDANFEAYLEANSMGDGIANNNYVLTANIENVTQLNINNLNISNLTGIEDFTALTYLDCGNNALTILDLSNNPNLTFLNCYQNGTLSYLNITQNPLLETLRCASNSLTELDVSNNLQLVHLAAYQNDISVLDISQNTQLMFLSIHRNNLSVLDVTSNSQLEELLCSNNQLTQLDVTNNSNLNSLSCSTNNISELDLSQNTQLRTLLAYNNDLTNLNLDGNNLLERVWVNGNTDLASIHIQNGANNLLSGTITIGGTEYPKFLATDCPNLSCVFVNNASDATAGINDYQDWAIDTSAHFVETEGACTALAVNNEMINGLKVFPNPFTSTLNLKSDNNITSVHIFNLLGQLVFSEKYDKNQIQINTGKLKSGSYLIKIVSKNQMQVIKLVKQ
jgi:Leucine-rich repeat (LRR) protein